MERPPFDDLFNTEMSITDVEFLTYEKGRVVIKTNVREDDLNPYEVAHGGYLFTLCDNVAGLVGYTTGDHVVTQNASISFIASAPKGQTIIVEGNIIHEGRYSRLVEVTVKSPEGKLFSKATFTMFPVKKIDAQNQ